MTFFWYSPVTPDVDSLISSARHVVHAICADYYSFSRRLLCQPDYVSHWKWTACRRMLLRWFPFIWTSHSLRSFPSISPLVSQQFLSLEFAQVLDKMAYLTIWQGDEVQRRVKGVVTWFELGENDKTRCCTAWRCTRRCGVPVCARTSVSSRTRTSKASSARCCRKTGWPNGVRCSASRILPVSFVSSTVRLITISCAGWRRRKASSLWGACLQKYRPEPGAVRHSPPSARIFWNPMEPEHPYRGEHPLHQPVPLQRTNPPFFRGDQRLHL